MLVGSTDSMLFKPVYQVGAGNRFYYIADTRNESSRFVLLPVLGDVDLQAFWWYYAVILKSIDKIKKNLF